LDRFITLDKPDFVGKAALEKRRDAGPSKHLVTLKVESNVAHMHGGASLMDEGRVVGTVTSGGWGYRTGLNLAYAFVDPDFAALGTRVEIDALGEMVQAEVIDANIYDPQYELVRG
jgi:dimethylglycine dehydrogenase